MTLKFSKQLRRFSLACLIAVGSTVSGLNQTSLFAKENTPVVADVDDWNESSTCNFQPADNDSQPITFGTHDSTPIYTRTASTFESSLAAIAATACASTGVSVEQMIEPFALVGNHIDDSAKSVLQLDEWWTVAKQEVFQAYDLLIDQEQSPATAADAVPSEVSANDDAEFEDVSLVPLVDFDSELEDGDSWATPFASAFTADPFDVVDNSEVTEPDWDDRDDDSFSIVGTVGSEQADESTTAVEALTPADQKTLHAFGHSVLFDVTEDDQPSVENQQVASAPFVGTAGVIASINEVYMPYDFAVRDLQVGSLFPLAKRPFCIRSRVELPGLTSARSHVAPSIQNENDDLVQTEVQEADTKLVNTEDEDELLEKVVWHTQLAIDETSKLSESLRPGAIGRQIAAFVVSRDLVVNEVATRLARVWPAKAPLPPSPAGAELLARANANADSVEPVANELLETEQIANRKLNTRR